MKIILSRKGFDSGSGGCPSPIFPDGSLMSLPIPDKKSQVTYGEIAGNHWASIGEVVSQLAGIPPTNVPISIPTYSQAAFHGRRAGVRSLGRLAPQRDIFGDNTSEQETSSCTSDFFVRSDRPVPVCTLFGAASPFTSCSAGFKSQTEYLSRSGRLPKVGHSITRTSPENRSRATSSIYQLIGLYCPNVRSPDFLAPRLFLGTLRIFV